MTLIRPFAGLRPDPKYAADVVAPPYDVLNTAEARECAVARPWSFLHISKAEIDLPEGTDPFDTEVYKISAQNLNRMLDNNILKQDNQPCYYFYRLIMGEHVQTGIVAAASVKDYDSNRIRKHELTRPDKEDDRVRQIDVLNAQTGPVFLTYRKSDVIDSIADTICEGNAEYDITANDGVRHALWVVTDADQINLITDTFDAMNRLYIADGHHRSAAASRVAKMRGGGNPNHNGDEDYNYFLSVIFPDDQIQILDYNRVIKDLDTLSEDQFLGKLDTAFVVEKSDTQVKPEIPGVFGMYLPGQWYRLIVKSGVIPENDPVGMLDVSMLQDNLIEPVLGISDPRRDKRIDFVGGIRGLAELEKRVDSGEMAVAFALHPTQLEQLMEIADANEVMPPKSTWFEPKLADGLVSHLLG